MKTLKPILQRSVLALGLAVLALFAAPRAPLAAQNVQTTGSIRGRVVDAAGDGIPGVLIRARSTETGLERTAITADNGLYVIRLLPPSSYDVSAEALGYATQTLNDLRVSIGQSVNANLTLSEQAVEVEGLVVTGDADRIDVASAGVEKLVTAEQIEQLPSLGRDFTDFITLDSKVSLDPGVTTGGQFAIGGQRSSQTNLQIDGVDANNAFFGENRGGARIPFVFSLESIDQFQIITNGYDVEYGNYSGGIVNVVTKSGSNDFEGTAYANYRSDALTGRGFLENEPVQDYSVTQYAARVSGPIVKDKAFFLASLDGQRRREPQIPLTQGQYSPTGSTPDADAYNEVQRFWNILENVYGVDNPSSGYQSFQTTNDVITLFGRADWNINDKHRLTVRDNFANYTNDNEFSPGFDAYYGESRAEKLEDHSNSFVTELSSVLGSETFNVLRFQYATEDRPRNGHELRPALITTLSNGDLIGYGGTFVGFHNNLTEDKFQIIDNFTRVFGAHTVKVGGAGLFTHVLNEFLPPTSAPCGRGSQGAGVFCFDDLDALEAGTPSSYTFNVQQGGGIPTSDFNVTELAVYLQDEWQATPKLTVTAGLRHDRQSFDDDPSRVLDVERRFNYETGTAPTDNNNISPRLALAYDLNGDGSAVVRAGAGYFFGRVPLILGGNVMGSERPVYNLNCTGDAGDPDAPPSPLDYPNYAGSGFDNPTACANTSALSGVPTYTIWNPDFEYPETFKANVGYESYLGEKTRLGVDLLYSRSTKLFTVRNLNLRDAQFTLANEGGRAVYTPAASFSPSAANLGARRFSDVGDVFVNYNDGVANSFSASLDVSHNLTESLRVRGSYTYTRAYDNGSLACCTSSSMYAQPLVGEFGPNQLGGFGDDNLAWGPSDFVRNHAFVFSGETELPYGFELSAIWRVQSGRPYTPAVSGDINGDGVRFNDRPYIFAPENLPLASTATPQQRVETQVQYAKLLADNSCIGDYVGQIVPRNTCRTPWTNQLDMRLTKFFETGAGQRVELQLDMFNVVNGLGQLFCSDSEFADDPTSGTCGWGRITTVSGANTDVYFAQGYEGGQVTYTANPNFAREGFVGSNLLLQFQTQLGLKVYF